ncbi:alpha/beta fold hydrolase [Tsukamurella sp. PLM1]|uniref:alpha/beta fold hydrolase n=1 Tax=Tsukamurella sp. PLM1 TaxID=2929795 RepID=UPI00205841A9|nr:alpha/beta fold hydrolase [Tsukamurella sp. PLM1]BDH56536.1 poly(R)-hydroxyalkanoic acid synthase [Tsukamurella sp. PLM1]
MSPITPVWDVARGLVREVERTQLRARRGIDLIARRPPAMVGGTPKDEVWSLGKAKLWRFRNDDVRQGPPLLLFLGLVGDSAIFDLFPGNSWAEKLVAEGFDVFLFDWGRPEAAEGDHDLGTYLDGYFIHAVAAVRRLTGADSVSMGAYCMGSLMLTLLLGSRNDVPVRGAVLFAPPCDYDHAPGFLSAFQDGRIDTAHVVDQTTGLVPEDAVRGMFRLLQPTSDIVQYVTLWENLWKDGYADAHRAINHWAWDHRAMAAPSFTEMVENYVKANKLVKGGATLAGRPVDLESITAPLLFVIAEKDEFVPPENSAPLAEMVGSEDVEVLRIPGGHAGSMMGSAARRKTMPGVVDWLERHSYRLPSD